MERQLHRIIESIVLLKKCFPSKCPWHSYNGFVLQRIHNLAAINNNKSTTFEEKYWYIASSKAGKFCYIFRFLYYFRSRLMYLRCYSLDQTTVIIIPVSYFQIRAIEKKSFLVGWGRIPQPTARSVNQATYLYGLSAIETEVRLP